MCDACHYAKQYKLPFAQSHSHSMLIFDMIHIDIRGPFGVFFINEHMFFLTGVDYHSRYTWLFL